MAIRRVRDIQLDCDRDTEHFIVTGNTFKYKDKLKALGGKWNSSEGAKYWEFPKQNTDKNILEDAIKKFEIRDYHIRSTASKKADQTKKEKNLYSQNKQEIDTTVASINKINERVYLHKVIDVPKNGYCIRCHKNWAKKINSSFYEKIGLSACPLCFVSWIK